MPTVKKLSTRSTGRKTYVLLCVGDFESPYRANFTCFFALRVGCSA